MSARDPLDGWEPDETGTAPADDLPWCDPCGGTGICPRCHGRGTSPDDAQTCAACDGDGGCPACRGEWWIDCAEHL